LFEEMFDLKFWTLLTLFLSINVEIIDEKLPNPGFLKI
jgi:hypothetical protein